MLSRCFLDFSVGVWAFVIGLCQISSCLSYLYLCFTIIHLCIKYESFTQVIKGNQSVDGQRDKRMDKPYF